MASYLLFSLLIPLAAAQPRHDCRTDCGGVEIHYPFGIGLDCSINSSFNIHCNHSFNPPKPFISDYPHFEVVQIDVTESQVRVKYPHLAQACFSTDASKEDSNMTLSRSDVKINFSETPYALSEKNWITVVGCDDFVRINGINSTVFAGCTSICIDNHTAGTCPSIDHSDNGCCRYSIPGGTTKLSFIFTDMHEHSREDLNHRLFHCSYAFVGERLNDSFSYAVRGLNDSSTFQSDNPNAINTSWVLDWWIDNQTYIENPCNQNRCCDDYRHGGIGYRCYCKNGYEGNPYRREGCTDINECSDDSKNDCAMMAHCKNTLGSYYCSCPKGYIGDGKKNGHRCYPSTMINVFGWLLG